MPMLKCPRIPFSPHTKALTLQLVSFHLEMVMAPNAGKKKIRREVRAAERKIKSKNEERKNIFV